MPNTKIRPYTPFYLKLVIPYKGLKVLKSIYETLSFIISTG